MRRASIGRIAGSITVAILAVLVIVQWAEIRSQKRKIETLERKEHEMKMARLVFGLRMPSEALYYDNKAMREIAEIRKKYWTMHGTEAFLPYRGMNLNYAAEPWIGWNADWPGQELKVAYDSRYYVNASFENWWLNNMEQVMAQLQDDLENKHGLGLYFDAHPDEFDRLIKPLLIRLTGAYHPCVSLPACRVLLMKGDHSRQVIQAIERAFDYGGYEGNVRAINDKYGLGLQFGKSEGADPNH